MSLVVNDIILTLQADFFGNHPENSILNVSIDSRSFQNNPFTLFFCIIGPNHNGHDYIKELIDKGVKNFVVSQEVNPTPEINFLKVEDTLVALQKFAAFYRKKFSKSFQA